MNERTTAEEVAALRAEIGPKLDRIEAVINELLVKRPTQKQLAKKMGVHPTTLSRRRAKLRIEQLLHRISPTSYGKTLIAERKPADFAAVEKARTLP